MRIEASISDSDWAIAAQGYEQHLQPSLGGEAPGRSCADLTVYGPAGVVWFETEHARAGYGGSVLYLWCFLREWLRTRPSSSELAGESVYQSPRLVVLREADLVRVAWERVAGTDEVSVPIDSFVHAVETFVLSFGRALTARSETNAVLDVLEGRG